LRRNRRIRDANVDRLVEAGRHLAEKIPYSIVALVGRFAVASVF
jgi:hypothetical protein